MEKIFGASWKTTLAGILTILLAVITYGKALVDGTPTSLETTVAQVILGVGAISARDKNVSTEQQKAGTTTP